MALLRKREKRMYQNHSYDAPSYLHLVSCETIPQDVYDRYHQT